VSLKCIDMFVVYFMLLILTIVVLLSISVGEMV